MAKKLNKKVAYTVLAIMGIGFIAVTVYGFHWLRERNPEYCLPKARQAAADGEYEAADRYYGKAYGYSDLDEKKIEILFEMADFHLTATPKHEPDWRKVISCWNTVLNIDPQNIEARQKILDYFYQAADSGSPASWKYVNEHATKLLEVFEKTKQQPDTLALTAGGRACLEIARQGSETQRLELVDKALELLEQLKKRTPDDVKIYEYITEAIILKGQLDEARGVKDARKTSEENAKAMLQEAIQHVTDKGTANAYLLEFELRQAMREPNILPSLRQKIETLTQTYPDSSQLFSILSACYELHGMMDRRQELERSVRYAEKTQELAGGQNVKHALRIASLLYRMGSFYDDKKLTEQAIKTAQNALLFPEAIVVAGPKENAARQNRYLLQSFLARCLVEQAIAAKQDKDEQAAKLYYDQANKAVNEITQLIGGSSTLTARQWQGMLALAEGNNNQAFRLLYKVYQEAKATDKAGEMSTVDSYLCYMLSRLAITQRALGLQREFLEKALYNRNSIAPEKPTAILDYVNIMLNFQAGGLAAGVLDSYIKVYGENPEVQLMRIQADILAGRFEDATKRLDQMDSNDPLVIETKLLSANLQLNRRLSKQILEGTTLTADEQEKNSQLRSEQLQLLTKLLEKKPKQVNPQIFMSICRDQIAQGQSEQIQKLVSSYIASQPENIGVQLLKLELAEAEPDNISVTRRQELIETVLRQIKDPVKQALALGQHYRSIEKIEQAKELYEKTYQQFPDNVDIANDYFTFLLEQKDIKKAEGIFSKIRNQNPDGYEGNLFSAQLEIAKENYPTALRRLDECVTLRPGSSAALMLKSQVYLLQKNYSLAVENARLSLQIDPQNGMTARLLVSALYERNRNLSGLPTAEQTAELEQAIGIAMYLNPGNKQLQSVYAELSQEKDPQKALAMRQALLKTSPSASNALMLGNMAVRMARVETDAAKQKTYWEIADNAYQQAYQMDPSNKLVQNTYAEFLRITQQRKKAIDLFANDEETLWRFYLNDGQYAQAVEILEKLIASKTGDIELLQGLTEAFYGMEQWEKMRNPLDQLAQQTLTADQEIWLIQKYMNAGFHEQAEKRLASFQDRYSSDERGQLLSAWLTMYQGNPESALELVQKYLEKETRDPSGWRLKGLIHRIMNQPQQAIDALQRSKSFSADPMVRMELSTIYRQTGQVEAAIGELVGGLNEPQAPPQMWQMLETLYTINKRYNELQKFYQQALEKFPNSPFWFARIGQFYLGEKSYVNAVPLLERAWNLTRNSPGEASALNNYLKALTEAQQFEKASAIAEQYLNTPLAPVAYCNIATIQVQQEQNDKAIDSFSKAIEKATGKPSMILGTLSVMKRVLGTEFAEKWCNEKLTAEPQFIPAHIILADVEEERGSYNKALSHIASCLEQTPQDSADWLGFSEQRASLLLAAYVKTADKDYLEQAIQQLEINIKLQPNNAETLNNLAYLLTDNNSQLDKAVEYSRRAFQTSPGNPIFLDTHAYALCKTGQFVQAERYLRQTIQLHEQSNTPPAWDVYKHLGMALEGQKKNNEARSAYEKALELGKEIPEKEKRFLEEMIKNLK